MAKSIAVYLLLAGFIFFVPRALSQQCQQLKVGYANSWYPVSFVNPNQSQAVHGVAIEILQQIAKQLELELNFIEPTDWQTINTHMDNGDIDVLAGHYNNARRQQKWLVSDPVFGNDIRVFFVSGLKDHFPSEASLPAFDGAYPFGASYGEVLDSKIEQQFSIHQLRNNTTLLIALIKGRSDYAIFDKLDGQAHVFKLGLQEKIAFSDFSLARPTVHFSFSKQSPCRYLFEQFNQRLKAFTSNRQLEQMRQAAASQFFRIH